MSVVVLPVFAFAEVTWLMRTATPLLGVCILAGLLDRALVLLTGAAEPDASSTAPRSADPWA